MMIYIKTNSVPEGCDYITVGEEYNIYNFKETVGAFFNDKGGITVVHLPKCPHLGGLPWEVRVVE